MLGVKEFSLRNCLKRVHDEVMTASRDITTYILDNVEEKSHSHKS